MSEPAEAVPAPAAGEDNITTSSTHHGEAPPVDPAEAANAEGETDPPAEVVKTPEEIAADEEKKAKGQERLNARFSELTSQREQAREEAARERGAREAAEAELARLRPAQPPVTERRADPNSAPDPTQYEMGEFDPKYIDDKISHGIRAALAEQGERQARTNAEQHFADRVEGVRGKLMDSGLPGAALLASGDPSIKCTPVMIDVLATMENAPQVADNLANNPAEAARIASLPPHLQGLELAWIDARLAGTTKVATTTKAPETTRTLAGLAPASDEFDPNMTQADFEAQHIRKYGSFAPR